MHSTGARACVHRCANQHLLTDVLRDTWGFDGYVTSDCGAINDVQVNHHFAPDGKTAAAMGLKAGCDTDCGGVYGGHAIEAVNASILAEATIDVALTHLAKVQMRLGLFEAKAGQRYFDPSAYGIETIDTAGHQKLALEAAQQSIVSPRRAADAWPTRGLRLTSARPPRDLPATQVLLKNEGGTLPFKAGSKIALLGPHVNGHEVFMSNYHGSRCADNSFNCIPSPLQAFTAANKGGATTGVEGVAVDSAADNITAAVAAAKAADAVVLLVGIDGSQEGEEHDRYNCTLPGLQAKLVSSVAAVGKPTVMVLIHGGAMCLGALKGQVWPPPRRHRARGHRARQRRRSAAARGARDRRATAPGSRHCRRLLRRRERRGGTRFRHHGRAQPDGPAAGHHVPSRVYVATPPRTLAPCPLVQAGTHARASVRADMYQNPLTQMSVTAPPGRTHLYYSGTPEFSFGAGAPAREQHAWPPHDRRMAAA